MKLTFSNNITSIKREDTFVSILCVAFSNKPYVDLGIIYQKIKEKN